MKRIASALAVCVSIASAAGAQKPDMSTSAWQHAAGDVSFEVASVRPDREPFKVPSFALSGDDSFQDPNGRFHADFTLPVYIEFAYKLWFTSEERKAVLAALPEWARTERFNIQATAPLHATKDQYRVMMQHLLAERFHLKLHMEQHEIPVLMMTLIKPGKPGPKLIPHTQGPPCADQPQPENFPAICYGYIAKPSKDGMYLAGSRATTLEQIAGFIGNVGGYAGEISRHVIDHTGLTGQWDFTLEAAPPGQPASPESAGTPIVEALRDQLGLTLKPGHATVPMLIIDHIDPLTEN